MDRRKKKQQKLLVVSSGDEEDSSTEEEETETDDTSPEESTSSSSEESDEPSDDYDSDGESSESTSSEEDSTDSEESLKKPLRQPVGKNLSTIKEGSVRVPKSAAQGKDRGVGRSVDSLTSSGRVSGDSKDREHKAVSTKKKNKKKKHKSQDKSTKKTKKTKKKKKKGSKVKSKTKMKTGKKKGKSNGEEDIDVEDDEDKQGKRSLLPPTTKNGRSQSKSSEDGGSSAGSAHKWDDLLKRGFNGLISHKGGEKTDGDHKEKADKKKGKKEGERRPSEAEEPDGSSARGDEEEKVNILGKRKNSKEPKKKEDKTAYVKVHKTKRNDKTFSRMYKVHEIGEGDDGHVGAVWVVEFSQDGNYMASGGSDSIVRVWSVLPVSSKEGEDGGKLEQLVNRKKVYKFKGHTADILDLSWSSNNFLVSASMDNTVRLWHTSCEGSISCFRHNDFVTSVAFHPMNNKVFMSGGLDKRVCVWNIPQKRIVHSATLDDMITSASFLPETADNLVAVGTDTGRVIVFEMEGNTEGSSSSSSHTSRVNELAVYREWHVSSPQSKKAKKITGISASPDGTYILITANDSALKLYQSNTLDPVCTYTGSVNKDFQISAGWSKTGDYVISGAEDPHVRIWKTSKASEKKDRLKPAFSFIGGHSPIVTVARFVPQTVEVEGEVVVIAGLDGVLHFFHCRA